ncbi:MAG: HAMP domain-containing protein [Deltaproteobacteria bacterium]|nr:HAMP domain-containing protein [Deltaproteobacteria bacterium]
MRDYLKKILFIFGAMFLIVNFGWIFSSYYLMSNSPEQMKVFSVHGIFLWIGFFIAGLAITGMAAYPVSSGLERLEKGILSNEELMAITKRNTQLPVIAGILIVVMVIGNTISNYIDYVTHDIGGVAANGIWAAGSASICIFYILMFGSISLITNKLIDPLMQECRQRGVEYQGVHMSMERKIWVVFTLFCIGFVLWLGMLGFYEGVYRIQEELKANALTTQKIAIAQLNAGEDQVSEESLNNLVDVISQSRLAGAFLSDRQGNILYNPQSREIYNKKWKDIDNRIRNGIQSGRSESIYENINEQVISYTPVNDSYCLGTVSGLGERMSRFKQFFLMSFFLGIVGLSVVAIAGLTLFRSIIIPIKNTVEKLKDISEGEGDLSARLIIQSSDETGLLAEQFNIFVEKLEGIISGLKNIAYQVDVATKEVAAGSQGLSQATQEQAAAVEEVAATIEEMTSSIKQNASNAYEGSSKVKDMVAMANSTGEASNELVNAMDEISKASKKIGNIIVTVNEVAFQTNLLALNAAVEAARAGEHGKGFAVVAQEVRALAQRSADAARQIKDLIEDTVNKIGAGDDMVKKSKTSLEEIITYIETLSQTMEEIALVSSEQASGIDELNRAIGQIDSTTQQNASTVEELASTSDNLSVEASELAGYVQRFKVRDSAEMKQVSKKTKPKASQKKPTSPKYVEERVKQDDNFEDFEEF